MTKILLLLPLLAVIGAAPAAAQDQRDIFSTPAQSEADKKARATAVEEYKTIKPGMLLDESAARPEGEDATATSTLLRLTIDEIMAAYKTGDYATTLRGVLPLAEAGHAGAQEMLGIMYRNGQGVPRDAANAFLWLSRAAEDGRPLAAHYLGVMYYTGEGTEKDSVKALVWLGIALAHYEDGPEKQRAQQDATNVSARLNRRDRERARDMVQLWLKNKGENHRMRLQD